MKIYKRIILLICLFLSTIILFGCGRISNSNYDLKVKDFDSVFNSISKDFYAECENSLNNQKPIKNLYNLYQGDIDKMIKDLDKLNEKTVPKDKINDWKTKNETLNLIMKVSFNTQSGKITDTDTCKKFKSLIEKKNIEMGNNSQVVSQTTSKPDLEVLNKEDKYVDKYDYAIIGEIKNNRDYPMRNVFIRINLYDKDKKLLGDAIDRVDILDANGIWKFKAQILSQYQKDFSGYKVIELIGYK